MNAKIETAPLFDKFKWGVVVILLIAGIITNSLFIKVAVALRLVGWIALVAAVLFIAYHTQKGKAAWAFIQESKIELRKVVWPTRQETLQTTLVIAAMVTIMALLLWGIDSILLWIISLLTGQRG